MLSAPCKISVSERRPAVKPKPATQIDAARRRCEARIAVVCDARLSPGARLLYVLLDDYAGMSGECWPGQETLAGRAAAEPARSGTRTTGPMACGESRYDAAASDQ